MLRRDALKRLAVAPWLFRSGLLRAAEAAPTSAPAATVEPLRTLEIEIDPQTQEAAVPTSVAISPNGQLIAAGADDHRVRLWNATDGTLTAHLDEHADWVRSVAFDPAGKKLVTAGDDHMVVLWDLATTSVLHRVEVPRGIVHSTAFRPDGKTLAAAGFDDVVRLIDAETGAVVKELQASSTDQRAAVFSPNNQLLACGGRDGTIRIWDLDGYKVVRSIPAHRMRIRALAYSPDGSLLASAGDDRKYFLWDANGQRTAALAPPPGRIFSLAFLGSDQLASGGSDNVIRILDVQTRRETAHLTGHAGSVAALAHFADGGLLASAGFDTTIRLWKPQGSQAPLQTTQLPTLAPPRVR